MKDREEIISEVRKLIDAEAERIMKPKPITFDQTPPGRMDTVRNFRNRKEPFRKAIELVGKKLNVDPDMAFAKELEWQKDFFEESPFHEKRSLWPGLFVEMQSSRDIAKFLVERALIYKSILKKKGKQNDKKEKTA